MSSLQCPARVHLARHGEAEYETDTVTDDGGSLTVRGREQARALAASLRGERIARVWTSSMSRAVQTAEIVAAELGVDVVVREGLREYAVGDLAGTHADEKSRAAAAVQDWFHGDADAGIPGGERVEELVRRVGAVLEEVADEHRGEAALVVSHGGAILAAVPALTGLAAEKVRDRRLPNCSAVELEADGDRWRLVRWGDED